MPPKKKIPKGTVLIVDRHERDQTARTVTVQPYQRKHVPRGPNKKPTKADRALQERADRMRAEMAYEEYMRSLGM